MWKQQIREEQGDDSTTVDGNISDEPESKKGRSKGKGRKEDSISKVVDQEAKASPATPAMVQEAPLAPSVADSAELVEVVVDQERAEIPEQDQDAPLAQSSVASSSSSPARNKKKKSNKKK